MKQNRAEECFLRNLIPYIRRKKNIKQYDLARALRVSPSYLCKIEKGLVEPTDKFMKDCSKYFRVSPDEIFIRNETRENGGIAEVKHSNRLWTVRKEKGIKQYTLARMLGCSPSYLSKIEKGFQIPNNKFKKHCAKILKMKEIYLFPM
jgi:putative transcriptional regulator